MLQSSIQKNVILLLADISGYTRFMLANQMDLLHGQWVISQLIETIIKHISIPLKIAKLEGDAIFLYAVEEGDGVTLKNIRQQIGQKLPVFLSSFSEKISELTASNTCHCNACQNIQELNLKVVVHAGQAIFYQLDKFTELAGPDVIIVHRLLKNSIDSEKYLLLSESAHNILPLDSDLTFFPSEEVYDELGAIKTFVHISDETSEPALVHNHEHAVHHQQGHPYEGSWFKLRTSLKRTIDVTLVDLKLRKPPQTMQSLREESGTKSVVRGRNLAHILAFLRIALGVILIFGGIKIAFPVDIDAAVQSYINQETGWISTPFVDLITNGLGLTVASFLQIQGILEILTGLLMIWGGVNTKMVGVMMAFMFWVFTIANPVVGSIRLSRDIALAGLCIAVALTGPTGWALNGRFKYRHELLLLIRLSLAYTLLASVLFTDGVFANPLNTTLPLWLVLTLGLVFLTGILPRWSMLFFFFWMSYVLLFNLGSELHLFWGIEGVKREVGLWAASLVYFLIGTDRWAWPKGSTKDHLQHLITIQRKETT